MQHRHFTKINESLYDVTFPIGFRLRLVPKKAFHQTIGVLSANYGSIIQRIKRPHDKASTTSLSGVAHFLEHKLFEMANGEDVTQSFTQLGAEVNAFTSYFQTSYEFSTTANIAACVRLLIDFVSVPHFSKEGVESERDIILQEAQMYEDMPSVQLFQQMSQLLYPHHPINLDIVGTQTDIKAITFEQLQLYHRTFYHPSNLALVLVGNFDVHDIVNTVLAYFEQHDVEQPEYVGAPVPIQPVQRHALHFHTTVTQPVVCMGVRIENGEEIFDRFDNPYDNLKQKVVFDILIDMVLGPTSKNYHHWHETQLFDVATFDYQTLIESPIYMANFSVSCHEPEVVVSTWTQLLENLASQPDLNEHHFQRVLKGKIGDFIMRCNSLRYIAYELSESAFREPDILMLLEVLEEVTIDDVIQLAHLIEKQMTYVSVTAYPNAE